MFRTAMLPMLLLAILSAGAPTAAVAQEQAKPRSLIDLLVRGRKEPAPTVQEVPQKETKRARVIQRVPRSSPPPQSVSTEKLDNARAILVVGDFTAGGLAQGLQEAFADVQAIEIVARTKGSSGFVRDDYYDWPQAIGPIMEEVKPALVIVMIGSNDRQAMRVNGRTENVRSEAWDKEYNARVAAFIKTIRQTNTPLIWIGGPPYRFKSMSADILVFNEFYRAAVEAAGGNFVDIWDGFVDQDGAFILRGSDVNGQTVQLRNSDGINFSKAGKRKLAFYAERQIKQMFGDAASALLTVLAPESYSTMRLPPLQVEDEPVRFDPIPFSDPELDGGAALLGDIDAPAEIKPKSPLQAKTYRNRLVEDGVPPPAKPGRANDFDWPSSKG